MIDLRNFEALTFDCYGTLVDWEAGILSVLAPFRDEHGIDASDDELLERFSRAEAHVQRSYFRRYRDVLREVMKQIAIHYRVPVGRFDEDAIAASLARWKPFGDTVDALTAIRKRYRIGVISNVDNDLFDDTARNLGVEFDWVITAQAAGAYKPALRVFTFAKDAMGIHPSRILHVAQSLFHDVRPANTLGWRTVWVDRRGAGAAPGATPVALADPDLTVSSLAELAALARGRGPDPVARDNGGHFYI